MGVLCDGADAVDLTATCVREFWGLLLPAIVLFILLTAATPKPGFARRILRPLAAPFTNYLSYEQAEALNVGVTENAEEPVLLETPRPPLWRTLVLAGLSLSESLVWLFVGSLELFQSLNPVFVARAYVSALSWLYATVRLVARPAVTAPLDIFALLLVHLAAETLQLGGLAYDNAIDGIPLPTRAVMAAHIINLVVILFLLVVVLAIPTGVPTSRVDKSKIGQEVTPEDFATLWQWCTFSWVYPLVKKGTSATLNDSDVWNLGPTIRARPVYIKFATILRSSLIRRIWAANSLDLMLDFIGCYISVLFNYAAPYFLRRILDAIDDPTPAKRAQAYIFTLLAFVCQVIKTEADLQHLWYGRRASTRIRIELMSAIYDKALKRRDFSGVVSAEQKESAAAAADKRKGKETKAKEGKGADDPRSGADIGKIVNLMAADANRTAMTISAMYFLYSAPFELVLGSVFLYRLLGWSAFAGFGVLVAAWPLNKFVTERSVRIQKGVMAARDKRMGVLNELIGAVKLIKFFAWEERWIGRALDAREKEMKWLIKARLNSIMFHALWSLAPVLVSTVSFAVYVALGNELTVATAFTAIALFQMIRVPLNVLPTWVVQLLQTKVAIDRITKFLSEDEVDGQVCSLKPAPSHVAEIYDVLGIEKGVFKWNEVEEKEDEKGKGKGKHTPEPSDATIIPADLAAEVDRASLASDGASQRFELRDITVSFPEGKLSVVTGPTASGKSALLLALLGEMTQLDGKLLMHKDASRVGADGLSHTIAYAAQAPWLRHQSIRANILFGAPLDEARYDAVLDACALRPDLAILEDGDSTEIGARGVSLSGGQKARVALARAVYARSRYVLLDDPLSAVDSHTARALFENLLMGPLLAGRTVILVTHHVDLVLPGAHYLVRMLDGRIDTQGTVADLRAQGVLESIASAEAPEVAKEEKEVAKEEEEKIPEEVAVEGEGEAEGDAKKRKKPRKLVKDEERQAGAVKWNIYKTYLQASSYWTWALLAFFIVCVQGLVIIEKVWIKTWGESYGEVNTNGVSASTGFTSLAVQHIDGPSASLVIPHSVHEFHSYGRQASTTLLPSAKQHPLFYVGVFALIGVASMLTSVLTIVTQYTGALRASRQLFGRLLRTVVCATMRWMDTTPSGRIMNRFSKDIETVDSSLASSLQAVNTSMASFLASVLTIAYIFPVFLIPAAAFGAVYYTLAIGYLNTGRDLRRMESNARSPIFSGFGEMLEGIVTVRAFSAERAFLDDLFMRIDSMTKMWYNFWMTNRWLLLNFDLLGAFAVGLTTFLALSGFVSAGIAGICITSAMAFTNSIYWTCRFWTSLELDLNSVERVVEYLDLPQEPPMVIEDSRPPATWPARDSQNLIIVDGLTVKYAPELPSVLHNVSFALKGGERIGLLGRTGSGKSTLAMSILRFVDPSEGRIIVDGVDITSIGLHDLRENITYIPQEAVLFSGTLRENLDPFDEHDDIECLDALHRVQMLTEASYNSQKASRQASRAASRPASPSASSSITDHAAEASLASATDVDSKAPVTLDTQVSPGGTNFSQGQRQLIAMARALLRRSSIVVLDEATSSIDYATDAKIQAAIRTEFGGALLLTVAHRLRTIIDYDRLIVLDKGQVAEFDTPWALLQKEDSIFRGMCLKSGSYAELEQAAREKAGA